MILKDPFSILKELGRFGSISEDAGPASPFIFLISIKSACPGKVPIFDENLIYQTSVGNMILCQRTELTATQVQTSGQFEKPSYSIFHPTTLFLDANTKQEK